MQEMIEQELRVQLVSGLVGTFYLAVENQKTTSVTVTVLRDTA